MFAWKKAQHKVRDFPVPCCEQERLETLKKEQEEEAVKECTFRPQINHKSKEMVQDRQAILRVRTGLAGSWGSNVAQVRFRFPPGERHFWIQAAVDFPCCCCCYPLLLQESGIPGYEQLFNESIRRRLKQESLRAQVPEEATFRPRINTSSVVLRKLMEGRSGGQEGGLVGGGGDVATRCGGAGWGCVSFCLEWGFTQRGQPTSPEVAGL